MFAHVCCTPTCTPCRGSVLCDVRERKAEMKLWAVLRQYCFPMPTPDTIWSPLTDGHCCWSSQGRLCHLQEEVDRKSSHRRKEDSEAQAWMQHNFNECKEEKEVAHREHQGQPPRCGAAPAGCPSACPSQGGREAKRSPLGWCRRWRQERK